MEIEFMENGFQVVRTNGTKNFVAYQAIDRIGDVEIRHLYKDYNIVFDYFYGENLYKYSAFDIKLRNGVTLEIDLSTGTRKFRTIDKDITGFKYLKSLLKGELKQGIDKEARNWFQNKEIDMLESVLELKSIREQLLKKFNEWSPF